VAIVVDQLGAEELLRAEPHLAADGGFGRAIAGGVYYERARYPYAATLTAPGHASLFTGVAPSEHGVSANELWDYATRSLRPATYDPNAHALGAPDQLGPGALGAETVAEALVRQRGSAAKVVSLSLKDRGAMFPVGRAGLAVWYDPATGGFTTSSAYAPALPSWLVSAEQEHPVSELLGVWQPLEPQLYAEVQGPDDAPWETDMAGFGRVFPHDPNATPAPLGVLRFMPQLSERLFDLAEVAVERDAFGRDAVPDLLVISVSGLDYTGHAFGPRSWEYLDHLLRIDRALGHFVDALERRGPVTFLLSGDHGVAPAPESVSVGPPGRVYTTELVTELDAALSAQFGAGPWVDACVGEFLYLSERAKSRTDVLAAAEQWVSARPGIARAFSIADLRARAASLNDPLERRVALSLGKDIDADLYLVQRRGMLLDPNPRPGFGTHHGSPYPYDTDVPVLMWGAGVGVHRTGEPVDVLRYAATVADLLGIRPPPHASGPSLR
jgi:arylsulfatase A-like enzyme